MGVNNIIYPHEMSQGVDLSMFVVLAAMVFWGWVLGPIVPNVNRTRNLLHRIGEKSDRDRTDKITSERKTLFIALTYR